MDIIEVVTIYDRNIQRQRKVKQMISYDLITFACYSLLFFYILHRLLLIECLLLVITDDAIQSKGNSMMSVYLSILRTLDYSEECYGNTLNIFLKNRSEL